MVDGHLVFCLCCNTDVLLCAPKVLLKVNTYGVYSDIAAEKNGGVYGHGRQPVFILMEI